MRVSCQPDWRPQMTPIMPETRNSVKASPGTAEGGSLSLENVHGSVPVPDRRSGFWRQMAAFFGPAEVMDANPVVLTPPPMTMPPGPSPVTNELEAGKLASGKEL